MNVDTNKLKKLLSVKTVKMADPETVLKVTGYPVGAVPPVAHRQAIDTYLDKSLNRFAKIYPAGGTTSNMFVTAFEELLSLSKAQLINVAQAKKG
jgi:prolyl-tRNA editing enzyme YbaK/EbsC (Cys-tRNA(Pro) deacylase)